MITGDDGHSQIAIGMANMSGDGVEMHRRENGKRNSK
jgi:hypothetical protein